MAHSVYWIHWSDNTDPWSQGYIGISDNPDRRLQEHIRGGQHKVQKCLASGGVMTVLWDGLTREEARNLEGDLRPFPNIGLNIAEGGGNPPVCWGHTRSEEERAQRSLSAKEAWAKNYDERLEIIRKSQSRPELSRLRSRLAKKQHQEGRFRGNKGYVYEKTQCADCGTMISVKHIHSHVCKPLCSSEGCDNRVKKVEAKYCSYECRTKGSKNGNRLQK